MLSNDIITEAMHNMHNREKKGQSGSNGGRQRDVSKFKLKGINSKSQLARGYFVEDMMNKIYDLVKGQLDSDFSYLAKPGESPLEDQMTLENYMSNWYTEYTRGLEIGQKLKSYANRIFKVMQEQWDDGEYKESLVRDLANATWLATQAPEGMNEPTPPTNPPPDKLDSEQPNPDQGQLDFGGPDFSSQRRGRVEPVGGTKGTVAESKTQSAIRAEKIPALKTR